MGSGDLFTDVWFNRWFLHTPQRVTQARTTKCFLKM